MGAVRGAEPGRRGQGECSQGAVAGDRTAEIRPTEAWPVLPNSLHSRTEGDKWPLWRKTGGIEIEEICRFGFDDEFELDDLLEIDGIKGQGDLLSGSGGRPARAVDADFADVSTVELGFEVELGLPRARSRIGQLQVAAAIGLAAVGRSQRDGERD